MNRHCANTPLLGRIVASVSLGTASSSSSTRSPPSCPSSEISSPGRSASASATPTRIGSPSPACDSKTRSVMSDAVSVQSHFRLDPFVLPVPSPVQPVSRGNAVPLMLSDELAALMPLFVS